MRVLDVAIKDWKQIIRDWKSALFLVVMPILFTVFFGIVMGQALNPEPETDPRLPVGIFNQDVGDATSPYIVRLLESSSAVRPVEISDEQAPRSNEIVANGEFAAVITVPTDYYVSLLENQNANLEVVVDQSTAAGQTAATAIETVVNRLRGAAETACLSADTYANQVGFDGETARNDYLSEAFDQAVAAWEEPPVSVSREMAVGGGTTQDQAAALDGFVQASSGMIVQFAIFGLITSAMILVLERKNKTMQRLLTTPVKRWEILVGHVLAMFVVVFLQEALLIGFGVLAFDIGYFQEPLGLLMMMVTLALWSASLGMLISAIAQKEEQVITLSLIAMFLFASLGGAWFPLEVAGKTFAAIGHIMPTAWAMDGFQNLLVRGLGLQSVLLPAGILTLYTLGFFALAVWRFEFE